MSPSPFFALVLLLALTTWGRPSGPTAERITAQMRRLFLPLPLPLPLPLTWLHLFASCAVGE